MNDESAKELIPIVSVVVVVKNEEKYISDCLDSLVNQDYHKDCYEIIVVDGGSTDQTQAICRSYPIKIVITRSGISHQRNVGVEVARGKYVAFTDADCIAENAWLSKLVEGIENSEGNVVAVGGPNLVLDKDPILAKIIGYSQETFLGSGGSPQSYRIIESTYVNSIPNCNILYKKEIITEEKYDSTISIGDDCELNFSLSQRSYKFFYLPDAVVWHHRPNTLKNFSRKMISYGIALGVITRKHKRIIRWYAPLVAFAVLVIFAAYPAMKYIQSAIFVYSSVVFLYLIALLISTVQVFRRLKRVSSLMVLILLPMQHFLYGIGFLIGILRFKRTR